jgi:UDP-GlcNAc:undecaprenyl-phosphate GlcNAc-1-phosphate transferase
MPILLAVGLCLVLTPLLGRLGRRIGLVDHPTGDELKIHAEPTPLTGGIGVLLATLVCAAAPGGGVAPSVAVASVMMLALGVADDLRKLSPGVRLAVQLAAGGLLAVAGLTIAPLGVVGPVAVVFMIPVLTNAMNMVDGQDGLAAGLAVAAAAGLSLIAASEGEPQRVGLTLIGALVGFLVWNRPPARVFLGDGGAYAVGCLLGVLAVDSSGSWEGLFGSVICLGVIALELLSTIVRRSMRGSSLLSGDRGHVYDVIAEMLGSRARATGVMWGAGVLAAGLGWAIAQARPPVALAAAAACLIGASIAVRSVWRAALRRSG